MSQEEDLKRVDAIKTQIEVLTREAMAIADRHKIRISFDGLQLTQARGAGGMTYHGVGNPDRYDDRWTYCTPESYGGWRSSATDMC